MKSFPICIMFCLLLTACGEEKKSTQTSTQQPPTTPLFQDQRQALDKARGVEQTLDSQARDAAKQTEQQSQ